MSDLPILWHIPVSHYSEKVRWALDHKAVRHERKEAVAGGHMLLALARTRGKVYTFPVMKLGGRTVGDSTAIIEALEQAHPDPPLYPADPSDRARALQLEDWFDENLGPQMRVLGWHEITREQESLEQVAVASSPPALRKGKRAAALAAKSFVNMRYRAGSEDGAERARTAVVAALDKLEAELGDREYLAGDSFSVADLTAASLFYPLVLPPEGPQIIQRPPAAMEAFRAPLEERRGYRWVAQMFAEHRNRGGSRA